MRKNRVTCLLVIYLNTPKERSSIMLLLSLGVFKFIRKTVALKIDNHAESDS